MATLTATMTDGDVVAEEDEDAGNSKETLEFSEFLHEIYREEVFNKADNLIDNAPSLPKGTQGRPLRQKRRRPGSHFFFRKDQMVGSKREEKRVITLTNQKASRKWQKPMLWLLSFPIHHCAQILIPMKRHPLFQVQTSGISFLYIMST